MGDYYHTDYAAVQAFSDINKTTVRTLDDGTIVFEPDAPTKALIFYRGGKVEYTAYQSLMKCRMGMVYRRLLMKNKSI